MYPSMPGAASFGVSLGLCLSLLFAFLILPPLDQERYTTAETFDTASRYTYTSPSVHGYGNEPNADTIALLPPMPGQAVPVMGKNAYRFTTCGDAHHSVEKKKKAT
jgi:hypothetical protein